MFGKSLLHDNLLFGFRDGDKRGFFHARVYTFLLTDFSIFVVFFLFSILYIRENSLQLRKMLDKLPVEILRMVIQEVGFFLSTKTRVSIFPS